MSDFNTVKNWADYSLAQLGITSIGLSGDTVTADFPDGIKNMTWAA